MVEGEKVSVVTEQTLVWLPITTPHANGWPNSPQKDLWKPLSVSSDYFIGCKKHAVVYIPPENYERKYYFLDCDNIAFQTETGETIWSTKGEGEMDLPADVGLFIVKGRMKG